MNTFIIKNAQLWINNELVKKDIFIKKGIISEINENININKVKVYDFTNCIVAPGLIDVHVHLREPGFEYKEDIASGTMAAAHGGYTTIGCMTNLKPNTSTVKDLKWIIKKAKKVGKVQVLPYSSITINRDGESKLVDFEKNAKYAFAFSDDGCGIKSSDLMSEAMLWAKEVNKVICAHAEDTKYIEPNGSIHECEFAHQHCIPHITSKSEWAQVERDLRLAIQTGANYHVCHISCHETVDLIRKAKQKSNKISCEVTPHHLLLNCSQLQDKGIYKVNPPLRSRVDQMVLLKALKDGTIDMIATDHAPHSDEEKSKDLVSSAFGIASLDYAFPLLYTYLVKKHIIDLNKLIQLMSINPAKRFNLPINEIAINKKANLMVFDPINCAKITKEKIYSKSKLTPFMNHNCYGWIKMTIADGKIVYQGDN